MHALLQLRRLEDEFGFAVLLRNDVIGGDNHRSKRVAAKAHQGVIGSIQNDRSDTKAGDDHED
jgi:hypothetical protein